MVLLLPVKCFTVGFAVVLGIWAQGLPFIFFPPFFLLSALDATLDNSGLSFLTLEKDKWQYQKGHKNVETILQDQTKTPPGLVYGEFWGKSRRKTFNDISSLCLQPLAVYGPGSLIQLVSLLM